VTDSGAADSAAEIVSIERARRAGEEAAATRNRVVWRLRPGEAGVVVLFNEGIETAYGVTVKARQRSLDIGDLRAGRSRQIPWPKIDRLGVTWHYAGDKSDEPATVAGPIGG
jgi:hypothetical protein